MPETEGAPPGREPEAAPDRCPACDGPLQMVRDQPERFCPKCGIFVEFLLPLSASPSPPEAEPEPVPHRLERAKLHSGLEAFAGEAERPPAEGQAEPAPPVPAPADAEPTPPPVPPAPPPTPPLIPEPAPPILPPAEEEPKALPPGEIPPPPPEAAPEPEPTQEEGPAPEPQPTQEEVPAPLPMDVPEAPEPQEPYEGEPIAPEPPAASEVVAETPPGGPEAEEEPETGAAPEPEGLEEVEVFECPRCGAEVAPDAPKCTSCGTVFGRAVVEAPAPSEPVGRVEARPHVAAAAAVAAKGERVSTPSRADRAIFYLGAVQVALGGSGLMLGSFLHDFFRVPFMGYAYSSFGPVNFSAFLVGAILLIAGAAAMAVGARRHRPRRNARPRGA